MNKSIELIISDISLSENIIIDYIVVSIILMISGKIGYDLVGSTTHRKKAGTIAYFTFTLFICVSILFLLKFLIIIFHKY